MQLKSSANYSVFAEAILEIQPLEIFYLLVFIAIHLKSSYPTYFAVAPVLSRVFAYFKYTLSLLQIHKQLFTGQFRNLFDASALYCALIIATAHYFKTSNSITHQVITFDWLIGFLLFLVFRKDLFSNFNFVQSSLVIQRSVPKLLNNKSLLLFLWFTVP